MEIQFESDIQNKCSVTTILDFHSDSIYLRNY